MIISYNVYFYLEGEFTVYYEIRDPLEYAICKVNAGVPNLLTEEEIAVKRPRWSHCLLNQYVGIKRKDTLYSDIYNYFQSLTHTIEKSYHEE